MGLSKARAREALQAHPDVFRRGAVWKFVSGLSDDDMSDLDIDGAALSAEIAGFLDQLMVERSGEVMHIVRTCPCMQGVLYTPIHRPLAPHDHALACGLL